MISIDEIRKAALRISSAAVKTPLIENAALNAKTGGRVLIKPECLQRSGSFKFRGAFNRLFKLSDAERKRGVVAWSSGNHAQGVAAAAEILGIRAAIVMPADAPKVKAAKTKGYGAEVIFYDRYKDDREEIGTTLAKDRGAMLVPSYDDEDIMAGQGVVGWEIAEQADAIGAKLDMFLCCCGGGGLIAGASSALRALSPATDIYSVEPDRFDDHAKSLKSGKRERVSPDARSICDALLTPTPGELTFAINKQTLTGGLSVSDDEVRAAMRYAFSTLKLVVEPGGAVALAAVLSGKIDVRGKTACIVLTGGNVDPAVYAEIIMQG